jgi:TRAP-type C4-dicarboxylate transport system, periplasmic component
MAELMGAVPTTVEAVEIPQAFSTGVVDAMVTSGATGQRTKAWDFSNHFYDLNAWMPKNMIFVNKSAFSKLNADEQKALLEAAAKAETRGWQMSEDIASASTEALKAAGMTVEAGSSALVDGLKGIGTTLTKQWLENAGDRGQSLMKAYQN